MTRMKRRVPGMVILRGSFLQAGEQLVDGGALPLIPPVDLYETRDCYVLNAELPGVESEDVHVEVRGTGLSIWGERKVDGCCCEESYHRLEGIRGRFHRTFSLPVALDDNARISATLKDGVLHVEIAKSSKSRDITIQPGQAGR